MNNEVAYQKLCFETPRAIAQAYTMLDEDGDPQAAMQLLNE